MQGCILLIAVTYVADEPAHRSALRRCSIRGSATNEPDARRSAARHRRRSPSLAALVGPWLTPFDPSAQELALRLAGPTWHASVRPRRARPRHPRARARRRAHLVARRPHRRRACRRSVGTLLGAVAGYFGGVVDDVISRVIDVLLAFPGLLLAIALVAVLGPSLGERAARADASSAGSATRGWCAARCCARASSSTCRRRGRSAPARRASCWRHVIPTAMPAVVVQATLGMAGAIIGEAALSFLGLGVQPPTPSWGTMLNGGRAHLLDAPHLTIFPGLAIALLVLGFNFLGDGLRDRDRSRSTSAVDSAAQSGAEPRVRQRRYGCGRRAAQLDVLSRLRGVRVERLRAARFVGSFSRPRAIVACAAAVAGAQLRFGERREQRARRSGSQPARARARRRRCAGRSSRSDSARDARGARDEVGVARRRARRSRSAPSARRRGGPAARRPTRRARNAGGSTG